MALPLDYVFAGAEIYISLNVDPVNERSATIGREHPAVIDWSARAAQVAVMISTRYPLVSQQYNHLAGQIAVTCRAAGDVGSINTIKEWAITAAKFQGFKVLASMAIFRSNPRRDGAKQPPVNTPGANPGTAEHPGAGNMGADPGGVNPLGVPDWLKGLGLGQTWGQMSPALIIGAVVFGVLVLRR